MSISKPNSESEPIITEPWEMSPELEAKLKSCEPEIVDHIVYLKMYIKEQSKLNKELHRKNIKLQVKNQSLINQNKVIEEDNKYCAECERRMIEEAEKEAKERGID